MMAFTWSPKFKGLYGVMQGRNDRIDTVSEEMHRIDKGGNLGWPYTLYDTALQARVLASEYGGDGETAAPGDYDPPLAALPAHQSPLDLLFYDGRQFPASYKEGAFIIYHGGAGACARTVIAAMTWFSCPSTQAANRARPRVLPRALPVPTPVTAIPARPHTGPPARPWRPMDRFMWWMARRAGSGASATRSLNVLRSGENRMRMIGIACMGISMLASAGLHAESLTQSTPVIDNDRVTVWDVKLAPGERGPSSSADFDSVILFLEGGQVRTTRDNDAPSAAVHAFGDAVFVPKGSHATDTAVSGQVHEVVIALKGHPVPRMKGLQGYRILSRAQAPRRCLPRMISCVEVQLAVFGRSGTDASS